MLHLHATDMFISEFEREESLWNTISERCKNRYPNTIPKVIKTAVVEVWVLKDCLRYLECVASKKRDYCIYLTAPTVSANVVPIHHVSISLFIIAMMVVTAAIYSKPIFLNDKKNFT